MSAQKNTGSIKMDARKFIHAINNGAQSKIMFLEGAISKMGAQNGQKWRLVSVDGNAVIFEENGSYMTADVVKSKGTYVIDNIKRIDIVEEEKADLFSKNCSDLIDAISENKYNEADKAFKKIESQRFRSNVIPESGYVTTRDGVTRKVIATNKALKENYIPSIIKHLSSVMKDSIEITEGRVVKGTFKNSDKQFVIPINEYTRRRVVARHIKEHAVNAYKSPSFAKFVLELNKLVSETKIREAVSAAVKFLREEQEFCLLNFPETTTLVENALAVNGIFDNTAAQNVSALFYKTNIEVNKNNIVEAWTKTAEKAQNAALMHNVKELSESDNFSSTYGKFLSVIFEETANAVQMRAKAYKIALEVLAPVLEKIDGAEDEATQVREMISRLDDQEVDDATIYDVEELLYGLDDELVGEIIKLSDYDSMPDGEGAEEETDEEGGDIVALPEAEGEEDEMAGGPPADAGMGGGMGGMPMPPAPQGVAPITAGLVRDGKQISEGFVPVEKMSIKQLSEELDAWKTDGHIWLNEDGFDDCFSQMQRYIKRCNELGPVASEIMEGFENIRDVMLETGTDVVIDTLHDPYAKTVSESGLKFSDKPGSSDIRMNELQTGKPVHGKETVKSDGRKGDGAKANPGSAEGTPRMDELQTGKPVHGKESVKSDGRKGDGAKANTGSVEGNPRMDELQTGKSVVAKKVTDIDGRSAGPFAEDKWFAAGPTSSDIKMSKDQGGKSVVSKTAKEVDGAGKTGADAFKGAAEKPPKGLSAGELQGNASVQKKTVEKGLGSKAARGSASQSAGLRMRDNDVGSDADGAISAKAKESDDLDNGGVVEGVDYISRISSMLDGAFSISEDNKFCDTCESDECKCVTSEGFEKCDGCKKPKFSCKCDGTTKKPEGDKKPEPPVSEATRDGMKGIKKNKNQRSGAVKGKSTIKKVEEDVNIKIALPNGGTAEVSSTDETIDGAIAAILGQLNGPSSISEPVDTTEPINDVPLPDSTPDTIDGDDMTEISSDMDTPVDGEELDTVGAPAEVTDTELPPVDGDAAEVGTPEMSDSEVDMTNDVIAEPTTETGDESETDSEPPMIDSDKSDEDGDGDTDESDDTPEPPKPPKSDKKKEDKKDDAEESDEDDSEDKDSEDSEEDKD